MASLTIHMCIAKEINKTLKIKDEDMLLLGSIAPDIKKINGEKRAINHFINNNQIDLEYFLNKYKNNLKDPYILGYYIHLYSDLLWENIFMKKFVINNKMKLLNGTEINDTETNYKKFFFNDYNNLNKVLLNLYNIDPQKILSIKTDKIKINNKDKLLNCFMKNNKCNKMIVFTQKDIENFIMDSSNKIIDEIKKW